jgi:hypothetical protein
LAIHRAVSEPLCARLPILLYTWWFNSAVLFAGTVVLAASWQSYRVRISTGPGGAMAAPCAAGTCVPGANGLRVIRIAADHGVLQPVRDTLRLLASQPVGEPP